MSSEGQIWALRMPGGATKILKVTKPITELQAKQIYRKNISVISTEIDKKPDVKWPLCSVITEQELQSKYSWCLQPHAMTGRSLYLIEVNNGVPDVRGTGK